MAPARTAKSPAAKHGIHESLRPLAFPVAMLLPLPGNPRRGDVDAVARSYAAFGQRKPVVARREGETGIVIAGNHQLEAAKKLGWTELAVVFVDDDDMTAAAFALADNRTADLGDYDDDALASMLSGIDDAGLLEATGYDDASIAKLLGTEEDVAAPDQSDELRSNWAVVVTCRDEAEQLTLLHRFTEEGLECRALVS